MYGELCDEADAAHAAGMWTIPEASYYGMTKAAALKKGFEVGEGVASYSECLRGRVFAPEGLLKLVFDKKTKVILGIHIIGADACELIHFGMSLVLTRATVFDVLHMVFTAVKRRGKYEL